MPEPVGRKRSPQPPRATIGFASDPKNTGASQTSQMGWRIRRADMTGWISGERTTGRQRLSRFTSTLTWTGIVGNRYTGPNTGNSLMLRNRTERSVHWLTIAFFAVGCGDAQRGPADLDAPGLESSKAALVASLEAWKANHRASGVLIGSNPSIGVVDSARADRPLLEYEIVGPLMTIGKARPYAVRLVLGEPRETVATRYLVIGLDPLWVFRLEDFERMLHWEHKMDEPDKADGATFQP
jgi:hypothetical protein